MILEETPILDGITTVYFPDVKVCYFRLLLDFLYSGQVYVRSVDEYHHLQDLLALLQIKASIWKNGEDTNDTGKIMGSRLFMLHTSNTTICHLPESHKSEPHVDINRNEGIASSHHPRRRSKSQESFGADRTSQKISVKSERNSGSSEEGDREDGEYMEEVDDAIIKSNNNLQHHHHHHHHHHQITRHDGDDDAGGGSGNDGSEGSGADRGRSGSVAGESADRPTPTNLSGSIGGGRRSGSGERDPEEDEDYELDVEDREGEEADSAVEAREGRRAESIGNRRRSSSDPVNLSIVKTQDVDSDDANIDVETIGNAPTKVS